MKDIRKRLGEKLKGWKLLQLGLTMLTGKPLDDQVLPKFSAWGHFLRAMASLSAGVGLAWQSCSSGNLTVLPVAWIMSLFGMRTLQLVIVHNAAHRNFVRQDTVDRTVGIWMSAVLMIESFPVYLALHGKLHHSWKKLSTGEDPTVKALEMAGIVSGLPVRQLKINLLIGLFSPKYHLSVLFHRLRSHSMTTSLHAKFAISTVITTQIAVVVWTGAMFDFAVAWLIPVTVLYQQAALLRLVVEHLREEPGAHRASREDAASLTTAIFLGAAPPETGHPLAWLHWAWRMLCALTVRLAVLPGDSGPAHDWHHMHPRGDWPNYLAERRKEVQLRPQRYTELWGYWTALEQSLRSIACEKRQPE